MSKSRFYVELESLRGLAALGIVFYHLPAWHSAIYLTTCIRNASMGVDFFFVLSGFVMMHNYGPRINNAQEAREFMSYRFFRIYPVHLLFLLVFSTLEIGKWLLYRINPTHVLNGAPFSSNSPSAFVENLFLIQSLGFTQHSLSFNYPSWSISVEFYTYLAFAVLLWLVHKRKRFTNPSMAALSLTAFTLLVISQNVGSINASRSLSAFVPAIRCVAGFFLGCLIPGAISTIRSITKYRNVIISISFAALLVIDCTQFSVAVEPLVLACSGALIAGIVASSNSNVLRLLRIPSLTYLGTISYSLYMSHAAVISIVNQFIRYALRPSERFVNGNFDPQLTALQSIIVYPLTVVLCISVAALVNQFYEGPIRMWVKQRRTKTRIQSVQPSLVAS